MTHDTFAFVHAAPRGLSATVVELLLTMAKEIIHSPEMFGL